MAEKAPQRVARFQVRIRLPEDAAEILPELDIDVLPQPARAGGDQEGILAVVTLKEIDRLVDIGARVIVERKIRDVFPPGLIMSEEEAEAQLEALARFRENENG